VQVIYDGSARLDAHKKSVSTCVGLCKAGGAKRLHTWAFGTFTQDLLGWSTGYKSATIEATSVCWRSVSSLGGARRPL